MSAIPLLTGQPPSLTDGLNQLIIDINSGPGGANGAPLPIVQGGTGATSLAGIVVAAGGLLAANNLSDVASASTSRVNLGLGSLSVLNSVNNSNWSGTALAASNGGTGVSNNAANTLTFSGNFGLTLTLSAATSLTLPTSGTVTALGNAVQGSGSIVLATSPTLTTPNIGAATAASINGLTITSSTGTLTIANAKTHVVSNSLTFTGTDSTSFAFPGSSDTVVGLAAMQTLTNKSTTTQSAGNNSTNLATTTYSDQTIVIGASTNVKAHLTAAGTTVTFTADEVTVGLSLGGAAVKLGSYSQSLNIATTGAGAMDTGTAPVSGFVCIYAIWGTNGTSILACNITSSSGRIYSGGHMPTGYTYSALIGIWPTNGSSQLVVGGIIGRTFSWLATAGGATQVLNAGGATTYTSLSLATYCPSNAVAAGLEYTGGTGNVSIASDTAGTGCKFCNVNSGWIYARFQIYTAQTLYYLQTGGSAFANLIDYDF